MYVALLGLLGTGSHHVHPYQLFVFLQIMVYCGMIFFTVVLGIGFLYTG